MQSKISKFGVSSTCLQESLKKTQYFGEMWATQSQTKDPRYEEYFFWIPKKQSLDPDPRHGNCLWIQKIVAWNLSDLQQNLRQGDPCVLEVWTFFFQTWCETLQGWICCMLPIGVRYLVSDLCGMAEALGLVLMQPSTDNILSSLHDDSSTHLVG